MMHYLRSIFCVATGSALVVACGAPGMVDNAARPAVSTPSDLEVSTTNAAPAPIPRAVARIQAEYSVPFDTLADWVSFGGAVVVFRVDKIDRGPLDPTQEQQLAEDRAAAESAGQKDYEEFRFTTRQVTATVEDVLWRRPDSESRMERSIEFDAGGWIAKTSFATGTSEESEFVYGSAPNLMVGQRYIGLFSRFEAGWGLLGGDTLAALDTEGRVIVDLQLGPPTALSRMKGMETGDVAKLLADARPHPGLEGLSDDPAERAKAAGVYGGFG